MAREPAVYIFHKSSADGRAEAREQEREPPVSIFFPYENNNKGGPEVRAPRALAALPARWPRAEKRRTGARKSAHFAPADRRRGVPHGARAARTRWRSAGASSVSNQGLRFSQPVLRHEGWGSGITSAP